MSTGWDACEVAVALRFSDYSKLMTESEDVVLHTADYRVVRDGTVILYWDSVVWEWESHSIDIFNVWMADHGAPWIYLKIGHDSHETVYSEVTNGAFASEIKDLQGYFEPCIALHVD